MSKNSTMTSHQAPTTFGNFELSEGEEKELQLAQTLLGSTDESKLRYLAHTTSNIGVQSFLIEKVEYLDLLAENPQLHVKMVLPLLREVKPNQLNWISASLFWNPAVVNNVNLFKIVFEKVTKNYGASTPDFAAFLEAWSGSCDGPPLKGKMDVEVLLTVAAYMISSVGINLSSPHDIRTLDYNLKLRKDEISEWVALNMPDFVGLPLSWVLKSMDFYV